MAEWFDDAIAKDPFDPAALAARNRALPETDEDPIIPTLEEATQSKNTWFNRLPRNIGVSMYKAAVNTIKTGADLINAPGDIASEAVGLPVNIFTPIAGAAGGLPTIVLSKEFGAAADQFGDELTENNTLSDDIIQGVAQFAIPYMGYLRAFGGYQAGAAAMNVAKTAAAETAVSSTAFDPHDGRMADLLEMGRQSEGKFGNLLRQVAPDGSLVNDYINWMTDRDDEGKWEGRFKNSVDNLVTSGVLGTVLKTAATGFKGVRRIAAEPMKVGPAAQRGSVGVEPLPSADDLTDIERARALKNTEVVEGGEHVVLEGDTLNQTGNVTPLRPKKE